MHKDDLHLMFDLINDQPAGFALPRHFYTSQDVYDNDIRSFWNHNWIWVGHVCQIPDAGDFFLFNYDAESIIIVRGRGGDVIAHLNICRHRGSRVCLEKNGNTRSFICPYHAWAYDLGGKLRNCRLMGPDFARENYGLLPVQVKLFQGLIFICVAEKAPPLDDALSRLAPLSAPFEFENLKLAHQASYPVAANWKLALENYLECYHCAPSHKEYSRSHTLKDPEQVTEFSDALMQRMRAVGLPTEQLVGDEPTTGCLGTDVYWRRYPLFPGYKTGSKSGEPLAPPLGCLSGHDGGATDLGIGPLNYFLIYADHFIGYRFVPRGLQETDMQIVWYVRGDAEEERDYSLDDLTWLWHVTSLDDERIIRHNQEGVNSHHFVPGPLSEMESSISSFHRTYFDMIRCGSEPLKIKHG